MVAFSHFLSKTHRAAPFSALPMALGPAGSGFSPHNRAVTAPSPDIFTIIKISGDGDPAGEGTRHGPLGPKVLNFPDDRLADTLLAQKVQHTPISIEL